MTQRTDGHSAECQRRPAGRCNQSHDHGHGLHESLHRDLRRDPRRRGDLRLQHRTHRHRSGHPHSGPGQRRCHDRRATTSKADAADEYTYVSTPTVSKLTPAEGPKAGKTTVTITGTGFTGAAAVSFGATAAAKYKVESSTKITATSPAGSGTVEVTVTTPGGTSAEVPADLYTYDPVPTITKVTPGEGPLAGATKVTITGTGFTKASTVSFGGTAAKASSYVSETELSAESPAGTGTVNVTVETAGGTSATSTADDFTYVSTPTVTKVEPSSGPAAGETSVTITGSNLTGASAVKLGSLASASNVKLQSPSEIIATSPAGSGTVNVTVTTPGGTSAESSADHYTYIPVPTVTKVEPSSGPAPAAERR